MAQLEAAALSGWQMDRPHHTVAACCGKEEVIFGDLLKSHNGLANYPGCIPPFPR